MKTSVKQIEWNGLQFQYHETGETSAPPLIALHALGMSAASWDAVAAELGQKYRVLALDQRGHGGSARTDSYSFELLRDDVLHFAEALGIERFTLMGHSMGGTVAYLTAEAHPARVDRLIIEDTPPPFLGKKNELPPKPAVELPFDWNVMIAIMEQLNVPEPQWWTRLPEITAPALLIGGGSTSPVPQDKLREVAELIPTCDFVTIEGAGHMVHEAKLDEFLAEVKRFLEF